MYFAEKHLQIAKEVPVYISSLPSESHQWLPSGHNPLHWFYEEQQGIIVYNVCGYTTTSSKKGIPLDTSMFSLICISHFLAEMFDYINLVVDPVVDWRQKQ